MKSTKNLKGYALMDIMKFAFACVIILLHTNAFTPPPTWFDYSINDINAIIKTFGIAPILRSGVPFFFISSAYFLFSKLERTEDKKTVIIAYCKRNLVLFGAWFLMNLLYIIMHKDLFGFLVNGQFVTGIRNLFLSVFFNNTFGGSWFLVACVITAIILGFLLYKIKSEVLAWIVAVICFLPCWLTSMDIPISPDVKIIYHFLKIFDFMGLSTSFMNGMIYFMIGREIAKHQDRINIKMPHLIILAGIAYAVMLLELVAARGILNAQHLGSSFLTLPVVTALLVLICLKCKMEYRPGYLFLRKASTIMFCSHYSTLWILQMTVGTVIPWNKPIAFGCTVLICVLLSYVIIKCGEKYKVFRYLY